MDIIDIHEAKAHLSRLGERAVNGEPFIIAKSGKPLVQVTALHAMASVPMKRLGFLSGQIQVPADFDLLGGSEIRRDFLGC